MTTYKALHNGIATTARKVNGTWLVGGDRPWGEVSILLEEEGKPAWFRLRGCVLKFEDWGETK